MIYGLILFLIGAAVTWEVWALEGLQPFSALGGGVLIGYGLREIWADR